MILTLAIFIGINTAFAQECIGGPGMCPEERKLIEEKEDYQNLILISVIGIPALAIAIGFVIWNNRKKRK